MKEEELDKELQENAPFLKELKQKGDGFKVPKGYFDGLEDAVFARLEASGDAGGFGCLSGRSSPLAFRALVAPRLGDLAIRPVCPEGKKDRGRFLTEPPQNPALPRPPESSARLLPIHPVGRPWKNLIHCLGA